MSKAVKLRSCFIYSSVLILFLSSIAKLISAFGDARILETWNPIFLFLTERQLLMATGVIELAIVLVMVFWKRPNFQCLLLGGLGSQFLLYHFGISAAATPCPCLGRSAAWLHVRPHTLENIALGIAIYFFVLGLAFPIWNRLDENSNG